MTIQDSHAGSSYAVSTPGGSETVGPTGGFMLAGGAFWAMLAAEALLSALAAAGVVGWAYGMTEPYCETCQRWMKSKRVAQASPSQAPELLSSVNTGAWEQLLRTAPTGAIGAQHYCSATLYRCPACAGGTLSVFAQTKSAAKRLLHAHIPPPTVDYLYENAPEKLPRLL